MQMMMMLYVPYPTLPYPPAGPNNGITAPKGGWLDGTGAQSTKSQFARLQKVGGTTGRGHKKKWSIHALLFA